MMMSKTQLPHISEDVLELYAMGRLSDSELEPVEEHLLVCHACQDALQETDDFVRAIRVAARELESQPIAVPWWRKWFTMPAPMLGVAACALLALLVFIPRDRPVASVDLQTMRGPETPAIAPKDASLTLNLSLSGLETEGPLRIEVADAVGNIVRKTEATRSGEKATAKAEGLKSGIYWVRLYAGTELLREYGLTVR
jgi:hypothetical protein